MQLNGSVSVILSGYRRPEHFVEQFNCIKNQTVKPREILFWQNAFQEKLEFDEDTISSCKSAISNYNFGVWSRFAYALNCKSEFICIFDDDTIPGDRWLENCLRSYQKKPGLYGTIGHLYTSYDNYDDTSKIQRIGWDGINNEEITQVDIVGHAWFFSREMLSYFWRELPHPDDIYIGEDMHFSFMLQKYSDLKTYVPPHPIRHKSLWGSLKGWQYGDDGKAIGNFGIPMMGVYLKRILSEGFKLINVN